jgi:hypothetical protein
VVAAAAQTNLKANITGSVPTQGVQIQLDSPVVFNLNLCLIGSAQAIFVLVTAFLLSLTVILQEVI